MLAPSAGDEELLFLREAVAVPAFGVLLRRRLPGGGTSVVVAGVFVAAAVVVADVAVGVVAVTVAVFGFGGAVALAPLVRASVGAALPPAFVPPCPAAAAAAAAAFFALISDKDITLLDGAAAAAADVGFGLLVNVGGGSFAFMPTFPFGTLVELTFAAAAAAAAALFVAAAVVGNTFGTGFVAAELGFCFSRIDTRLVLGLAEAGVVFVAAAPPLAFNRACC
jgi:hypothetical protein